MIKIIDTRNNSCTFQRIYYPVNNPTQQFYIVEDGPQDNSAVLLGTVVTGDFVPAPVRYVPSPVQVIQVPPPPPPTTTTLPPPPPPAAPVHVHPQRQAQPGFNVGGMFWPGFLSGFNGLGFGGYPQRYPQQQQPMQGNGQPVSHQHDDLGWHTHY